MKSTNLFAGLIVVIVIAIAAYVGVYKMGGEQEPGMSETAQSDQAGSRDIFNYVPADTIFFYGGLTPVSIKEMAVAMNPGGEWMQQVDFSNSMSSQEKEHLPPAAVMFTALTNEYMEVFKAPETVAKKTGVTDKLDIVTYSVGFIPVMRVKLAEESVFNNFIDAIEKKEKLTPTKSKLGNTNLRTYSFDLPDAKNPSEANLLIASNSEYAIFSLATNIEDEATRGLIVGTQKPATPLDTNKTLTPIKNKYNFHPAFIGYINHLEIMKGITGDGNGEFGKMLDAVISMANKSNTDSDSADPSGEKSASNNENPLQAVRTDACRKELSDIVKSWPQTVVGYTKLDFEAPSQSMEAKLVVEGTDAEFMKSMQSIRGFIPAMLRDVKHRPVFGFGLGLNIDNLSPFVAKATQAFTSKEYQCDFLAQIKMNITQSNPAMALGMMSGMAAGLQGISITALDIEGSMDVAQPGSMPQIKKLDAIITITSTNPQQLLMMLANMQPGMPPIQLPPDGSPIDLPIPLPDPSLNQIKLALKGNHIVAYIGEKAAKMADEIGKEEIKGNGLFAVSIDFGKYMSLILNSVQAELKTAANDKNSPLSETDLKMLEAISKTKIQLVETMDIKPQGVAFDIKMAAD